MKTPKYVIDLLSSASYSYETALKGYCVGYTIDIPKPTPLTHIETHKAAVNKLLDWITREYKGDDKIAYFNHIPCETRYAKQHITITILDPMMKRVEAYINQ